MTHPSTQTTQHFVNWHYHNTDPKTHPGFVVPFKKRYQKIKKNYQSWNWLPRWWRSCQKALIQRNPGRTTFLHNVVRLSVWNMYQYINMYTYVYVMYKYYIYRWWIYMSMYTYVCMCHRKCVYISHKHINHTNVHKSRKSHVITQCRAWPVHVCMHTHISSHIPL